MQGELNFTSEPRAEGYTQWITGRQMAARELARKINLPVGHEFEVWLHGGVRLKGRLSLREEILFVEEDKVRHLELVVDDVAFSYREMESCVRKD
jgi:hypothetical protein